MENLDCGYRLLDTFVNMLMSMTAIDLFNEIRKSSTTFPWDLSLYSL